MRRRIHRKGTMALLGLQVPKEMKKALDDLADAREMSTSSFVRAVLKGYLTSREKVQADARRTQDSSVWPRAL